MIEDKRVIGIILARGGSKSIPRKNIRPLRGVPLIAYTICEGLRSKYIDRLIVSSEDDQIIEVALCYGAEAPFRRPDELATDTATSSAAIQHAVGWAESNEGARYDYIVELMCTNPLKTAEDIDLIIEKLVRTQADSVIGVVKLEEHHPARIKKIVEDKIVDFCFPEIPESRRQDLKPDAYIRNGSIYAIARDVIMEKGLRHGTENSRPYIFPPGLSANLDTWADWYAAEYLLKDKDISHLKPKEAQRNASE